jgi:hypothetical protein
MFPLQGHRRSYVERPLAHDPVLIPLGGFPQQFVQMLKIARHRDRHQMIPPEESAFSFHPAFLIAPRPIAELGLVTPVRAEGDEPRRLLPLRSPQDSLHRRLQVVIAQQMEGPPKW